MIVLETDRAYLRTWVPDDWIRFKPLVLDPEVMRYISHTGAWPDERIRARVLESIEIGQQRGWQLWPVIHKEDSKLIGFCGFSDGFPPDVEIGWRLLPEYWGQGLATEVATATLELGFHTWQFPRVIAIAQTPNRASIRVMEKLGMKEDGSFEHFGKEVVRYAIENPDPQESVAGLSFETSWAKCEFEQMPWQKAAPYCRVKQIVRGNRRLRMVEFQEGFVESGWCTTGHNGVVLDGELEIEFASRRVRFSTGDALFIPPGEIAKHRAHVPTGKAILFLVEELLG